VALPEHLAQELVVGLYDRGAELPSKQRILDIGTSKILKSKIWSPYLVNLRPALSLDSQSQMPRERQKRVKGLLLESVGTELDLLTEEDGVTFDHIFGPPEAGTPLASAVSGVSGHSLLWKRVIPKGDYGSHEDLEGVYFDGQDVVEVDDVVTKADTKREAAEFLASCGLNAVGVVIAFDREQGGSKAIEDMGMKVRAALRAKAAFAYLLDAGRLTQAQHDFLVDYTVNPAPLEEPADHPWKNIQ
jgi:orotate phosphoribosyltransferase